MMRLVSGNSLTLLRSGAEYFPALEAAIDRAHREIFLESYIYEYDETGQRVSEALKRAASRGVTVHLLLDGFGSRTLPEAVIDDLCAARVQLLFYRREISPWTLKRHRLRRLHRKIAVIDTRIAFVGGINVIDDMDAPGQIPPRFDYAVAVEGPLLAEIHQSAKQLWTQVARLQLRRYPCRKQRNPLCLAPRGSIEAAFVRRDNIRHRHDIENAYLDAIVAAREEIIIANAYFLPGRRFRQALVQAAVRGVRVVLLLQGRVEYALLHYASRALYGVLLDAGIEIYGYHKSFLHAKVAVIDRNWVTVGSSNIDPFSLMLAREANIVALDNEFAATLRESLLQAVGEGAHQVAPERWHQQPLYSRFLTWASYGMVRFLMGVAGYARRYEES
ncbi:MAG: cardiolipin synthase ClsB [Sulfuricella sp.]|nr:cardiolipin synthase ClsB [Sulfuricella sp.]